MSTYYDWRTGAPGVRPGPLTMTYGERTPNLVGVGAAGAGPKPPGFPTYTAGPFGQKVPYDPSLYGKKPTAKKTLAGPKAPVSQYDQWIKMLQSYIETPAQQTARIQKEIDAQIAAQKKMLDDEYQRQMANARAMAAGQEAAGAAAAAMNKDLFGSVGGEFNAAAGEIKGLAHGLSKGVQGATAKDVGGANAFLAATGNAPIAESGTFSIGGGKQQGVEEYRGGTLPGQMFGTQGEAANFGLAGMISSQGMKAHEEAQAALITTTREINDSQSKAIQALAAGRGDLYHTYMNDAKDSQIKYISLVQGLISAKQEQTAGTKPITQKIGNTLYQYDTTKRRWVKVAQGDATATKPTTKTVGGSLYQYNPDKNQWELAIQKPTDMSVPHTVVMGKTRYQWDPTTNQWVGIGPAAAGKPTAKKGPTAATMSKAQDAIERWFYGTKILKGSTTPQAANRVPGFDVNDPATWGGAETRISYVEALKRLTRMKIPRKQAINMVNEYWERGQGGGVGGRGGRPLLSQVERRAAVKKYGLHRLDRILMTIRSLMDVEDDPNDEKYNQAQLILNHLLAGAPIHIK